MQKINSKISERILLHNSKRIIHYTLILFDYFIDTQNHFDVLSNSSIVQKRRYRLIVFPFDRQHLEEMSDALRKSSFSSYVFQCVSNSSTGSSSIVIDLSGQLPIARDPSIYPTSHGSFLVGLLNRRRRLSSSWLVVLGFAQKATSDAATIHIPSFLSPTNDESHRDSIREFRFSVQTRERREDEKYERKRGGGTGQKPRWNSRRRLIHEGGKLRALLPITSPRCN